MSLGHIVRHCLKTQKKTDRETVGSAGQKGARSVTGDHPLAALRQGLAAVVVIDILCLPSPAQGLRSCTQIAGCLVSLSMLSPRLTLLLMIVTPTLMGIGTLMGSSLRKLSRLCQEQVPECLAILPSSFEPVVPISTPITNPACLPDATQVARATGVADEALGNVRTVRAFAMEQREEE